MLGNPLETLYKYGDRLYPEGQDQVALDRLEVGESYLMPLCLYAQYRPRIHCLPDFASVDALLYLDPQPRESFSCFLLSMDVGQGELQPRSSALFIFRPDTPSMGFYKSLAYGQPET